MGIVKAIASAVGGSLADQWLEVFEPDEMSDQTVFTEWGSRCGGMTDAMPMSRALRTPFPMVR